MRAYWLAATLAALCACGGRTVRHAAMDLPAAPVPTWTPGSPVVDPPPPPPPVAVRDPAPPRAPAGKTPARDFAAVVGDLNASLVDAYFDYDRAEVTAEGLDALRKDGALLTPLLREFPQLEIVVEGHCDERGSAAYNLGLGARRSERAIDVLVTFGVARDRLRTVSYGSEKPQCSASVESCWRLNRRAHLSPSTRRPGATSVE